MNITNDEIDRAFNVALTQEMPGGKATYIAISDWCDTLFRRFGSGSLVGVLCFLAGVEVGKGVSE